MAQTQTRNSVGIRGNLVADPEFKEIDGKTVCNFRIGVNHNYTGKDGAENSITDGFFPVETWVAADKLKDVKKGDFVALKGHLKQDKWEKDGQKFSSTKILATDAVKWDFAKSKELAKDWPENSVVLKGNLVKDVEIRDLEGGKKVANIAIAVSADYKKDGEWVKQDADFIDIEAWDKRAEALQGATKGTTFAFKGSLKQERWVKDGKEQFKIRVSAADVQKVEKKSPAKEVKEPERSM